MLCSVSCAVAASPSSALLGVISICISQSDVIPGTQLHCEVDVGTQGVKRERRGVAEDAKAGKVPKKGRSQLAAAVEDEAGGGGSDDDVDADDA